jgi:type II secretory pathway component HofQ
VVCAALRTPARGYRQWLTEPRFRDVERVLIAVALAVQAPLMRPVPMPALPLTQLDDRGPSSDLDKRTVSVTFAHACAVQDLLLLLVRGTRLSIVADPAIDGTFVGELKNVTVRQALGLILPPLGLDYAVDGPFIRVFHREPETRLFDVNYVATERTGTTSVGGGPDRTNAAAVTSATSTDLFAEIGKGVRTLLSEHATFNVDRKAGLLQVTDFPERLDRVATYLDAVHDRVHRQVRIDARVFEVELNDPDAQSIDLAALMPARGAGAAPGASQRMLSGLRPGDVTPFMTALAAQGRVSLLADPRVLALNNETAIVRAVTRPAGSPGSQRSQASENDDEEGMTLAVTPQIAAGGIITLSLSPIVSVRASDATGKTPGTLAVRSTDTLARVVDGETLVMAGFTREREVRERTTGLKGGWFGRRTIVTHKRVELLILLTPNILSGVDAQ